MICSSDWMTIVILPYDRNIIMGSASHSAAVREGMTYALQQGPQAGDTTTDPRSRRTALQAGRHRRRGTGRRDVRRRPDERRQSFDAQPSDRAGLEAFVRSYLSPEHRDQFADGCPSAALLDEIARRPTDTRDVFTNEVMGVIDDIASRLDPSDVEAGRAKALTVFGLMVGTLQLARTLTDRRLSDQLLDRGVETALKLLDEDAA